MPTWATRVLAESWLSFTLTKQTLSKQRRCSHLHHRDFIFMWLSEILSRACSRCIVVTSPSRDTSRTFSWLQQGCAAAHFCLRVAYSCWVKACFMLSKLMLSKLHWSTYKRAHFWLEVNCKAKFLHKIHLSQSCPSLTLLSTISYSQHNHTTKTTCWCCQKTTHLQ